MGLSIEGPLAEGRDSRRPARIDPDDRYGLRATSRPAWSDANGGSAPDGAIT
jgi:hypothetical protein